MSGATQVIILDPSEHYRPENKDVNDFRTFSENSNDPIQKRVQETYLKMHTFQTVQFGKEKREKWEKFNTTKLTVMEALEKLNDLIDESDPDTDLPNIVHAFQTAEKIREAHPTLDWFHLTGLIHDLGKIMAMYGEPQWCVVGDTFVVGCEFAKSIAYRDSSFKKNPDLYDDVYSSRLGIYEENCGLDNVMMSWGHDEYLYKVLKHNNTTLPDEALYAIRYHSFYPWHTGGDYMYLCNKKDLAMMEVVREFNKFDLYSKCEVVPDIKALMPYYQSLIDKYIPGVLEW